MKRLEQYDVYSIPVNDILYDADFNCRGEFTLQSVKNLADSIEQNGLQFPVVVQPFTTKPYRLLAGHRRYKACTTFLKWNEIPATIRADLTEKQAKVLNFTENLERKDLNILEEAKALANCFGRKTPLRQIANEIKRDTRWVHVRLKLLDLPKDVQLKAAAGLLTTTNINAIWRLPSKEDQRKAAAEIAKIKRKGKKQSIKYLDPRYQDCFKRRKVKSEVRNMVARMLNARVEGLGPRALVWAVGEITDEELWQDVLTQLEVQKQLGRVTNAPAD
jgi:ParB family chromosome partitioning protein